jgi:hypothetical protein
VLVQDADEALGFADVALDAVGDFFGGEALFILLGIS